MEKRNERQKEEEIRGKRKLRRQGRKEEKKVRRKEKGKGRGERKGVRRLKRGGREEGWGGGGAREIPSRG
jgi:hypothetical protein